MKLRLTIPAWATHIVSDMTDMDRNPHPVDARRVTSFALELPDDVYFEYAFLDEQGAMRADPECETRADNPWYKEVSAVAGPDYRPDPYAVPDDAPAGNTSTGIPTGITKRLRLESRHLGQTRRVSVYTPQAYAEQALPVVLVQDGVAFYRYARLQRVLETLLRDGLVRPAHLVFIEPVKRSLEYGFNTDYRRFVTDEVIPEVERSVSVTAERAALGASLGGLVSMHMALEQPELFRSVAAFSGAFLGTPEDTNAYSSRDSWVCDELERRETLPLRFYTETGTLEWLTAINRDVARILDARGYEHRYRERRAGHNWTSWKNGFREALTFVLEPH